MGSRQRREWSALVPDLRPEGRNANGQSWLQETSDIFIRQWFHDRECCIQFWRFFFKNASFSFSASIAFPLLIHPQKQFQNLSSHFFTGATHKFRRAVIQVFPTPVSSYSSTDLQHIVPLHCLGSGLTPTEPHENCIAKLPLWRQSPARAPCPRWGMYLPAALFHIPRAAGCIRAAFAWRHSVTRALKWIESYSKQIVFTQQRTQRRTSKWFIIMKQWSEIFWIRALIVWKV